VSSDFLSGGLDAATVAIVAGLLLLVVLVLVVVGRRRRRSQVPTPPPSPTLAPPEVAEPEPEPEPEPELEREPEPAPESAPEPAPKPALGEQPEAIGGRFARLRSRVSGTLAGVLRRGPMDDAAWDELEEALLVADVGAAATDDIIASVRSTLAKDGGADPQAALRDALISVLNPAADRSLALGDPGEGGARTVLVVGVNGVGKTTTVGKLARVLVASGHSVVLGAADTFRAAAADQLETWGARVGVPVERSDREGADPASVAFAATERAIAESADVVLIDTAGRLQNKSGLMDELGKISRVMGKLRPASEVLLVLDATTGQNGLTQARVFAEVVPITGIVLTKLDGSAKGGIVVAVQRELGVPVKFVGLGEGADDLAPFDAQGFAQSLVGE
jgi:fused signal recognition particle receptor